MAALPTPPTHRAVSLLASSHLSLSLVGFRSYFTTAIYHCSLCTIYFNTNCFHCIPFIIPAFVVQNLSFVRAHVKDSTYRQYGFTVIAAVIC